MNLTKNRGCTSEGEGAPAPLVAYPPFRATLDAHHFST
jgi:hypothetical protein